MKRALAASILTALCLPVMAQAQDVVRRAVVVGANDGGSYFEPLLYAERDAEKMSDVLVELADFKRYDVDYLATPTPEELDEAFSAAAAAAYNADDTLFLFYYSGHADEQGLHIAGDVYPWDRLKQAVRDVPADVHLGILDACRSGTVTRIKGASVSEPFLPTNRLDAEGEAWISSAADDEDAQESDQLRGSFFTYYLVSGLRGAADDGTDGYVSLNEAYTYAYDRTVSHTSGTGAGTQHPRYAFDIQGNGDLRLTSVSAANASIAFPEGTTGEVVIMSMPDESPVGELSLTGEREVILAVQPGDYRLRRRHLGVLSETLLTVDSDGRATVVDWSAGTAEATTAKGNTPGLTTDMTPDRQPFGIQVQTGPVNFDWLRQNKAVAGVFSAFIPGAGQMYAGRWVSGSLFFGGTLASNGLGWGAAATNAENILTGSLTGPNLGTFAGLSMYTWNIADAIYRTGEQRPFGPRNGVAIAMGTTWNSRVDDPPIGGLSFDIHPTPEVAFGLDRIGIRYDSRAEEFGLRVAGRVSAGPATDRWRPAAFFSIGAEYVYDVSSQSEDSIRAPAHGAAIFGVGGLMRWYATPAYFFSADVRGEWSSNPLDNRDPMSLVIGAEFGLMIGRRANKSRPEVIEE
ncbi:MAG: TM2 domain-containing membrane protein YozV [Myxococcota bacterium]|jgi:TM2 domain-containing membrane protein YozV